MLFSVPDENYVHQPWIREMCQVMPARDDPSKTKIDLSHRSLGDDKVESVV